MKTRRLLSFSFAVMVPAGPVTPLAAADYHWDAEVVAVGSGGARGSWYTTTVNVDGSIAIIPEPAAALLGGWGALLLLRRRRNGKG